MNEHQDHNSESTEEVIHDIQLLKSARYIKNHPPDNIIGNINDKVITRRKTQNMCAFSAFLSQIEPKNAKEAILDENWLLAMQEELQQFERCQVWELIPPPKDVSIIGTKWVFKNKLDEYGTITRNKARLVAQGYN